MKLKLFTFLLAVSFSIHAEESHYEKLSIKNEYDLLNVIIILTDHTILTNNLINTTQKTEFWNNKELRIKALECDVQELNRIKLRLYEKHKTFLTEQEYLKKINITKSNMKPYIPNCDYVKEQDSKANWKKVAV